MDIKKLPKYLVISKECCNFAPNFKITDNAEQNEHIYHFRGSG